MKTKIQNLLKEMIPVILGILIALFINDWKENKDNDQFLNVVMGSISEELKENKTELTRLIEEHKSLLDTIAFYRENEEVSMGAIISKAKGVRVVSIKNTAWKTLMNSHIDLVEYEKISLLTNIAVDKVSMESKFERLTDLIYEKIGSTDNLDKELFHITINDLLYLEGELLESHEEFLKLQSQ
ncbi:MAG: hypothetical protein ACPG49_11810 [Chitinophagales bacterium]